MWKEVKIEGDRVLGLECAGKLTEEDFRGIGTWLDEKLAGRGKPALVLFLGRFEGYENASALWQDMKIDAKRSDDLSRVAMVADQAWIKWGASAADLATGAKLKWFDTSERDAAIAWARDG